MEAVMFIGVQGAGKSSFFKERFYDTHVRLNLDMLRTRHRLRRLAEVCIETRQRFVLDNTHPARAERAPYIELARAGGFRVIAYYFDVPLSDALRRNEGRAEGQRVPAKAVISTYHKLQPPAPDESFDCCYRVTVDHTGGFVVEEWRDAV